ncbi:MAG: glycosyl hydrolase family 32, partial [Candidatus Nealsonbacteria bacterium]
MYYSPANSYMWDFWLVKKKDLYHIYYLQAPRSIQNPDVRHSVASVGHAVSKDLEIWKEDGTVLEAGPEGSWDDTSIWTGSVIEKNDKYYMFYTSRSKREAGKIQRIGVAISEDLYVWEKYGNNPVMEADPNWYEKADISDEELEHWRDPFIIYNREDKFYYAFICARVNHRDYNGRGCIARAKSRDLLGWEVMSPATDAGNFYEMEVPDLHFKNGRWYLLFTTSSAAYSEKHKKEI